MQRESKIRNIKPKRPFPAAEGDSCFGNGRLFFAIFYGSICPREWSKTGRFKQIAFDQDRVVT